MPAQPTRGEVLETLVTRHEKRGRAQSPETVATALGADREVVEAALETLAACELVAAEAGGYRPTLTGREFLALDAEGEFAVVDPGSG